MSTAKVTISINQNLLAQIDELVKAHMFSSRSQIVQEALEARLSELKRQQFDIECQKLQIEEEQSLADEGLANEVQQWPTY
jgi:metal-responsive CopG/Arc/MetJ family transcriptional regulator